MKKLTATLSTLYKGWSTLARSIGAQSTLSAEPVAASSLQTAAIPPGQLVDAAGNVVVDVNGDAIRVP